MGLSNYFGLFGLLGIPVIIILYMLQPKNKPVNIPSLYLWKKLTEEIESASRLKKLKSSLLMFIQLLIVILLSAILSGLFLRNQNDAQKALLVVECSYTMGSTDVNGNRLELAKQYATDYLKEMGTGTDVTLLVLEEVPRVLLTNEKDKNIVQNAISDLQVVDGLCDKSLAYDTIRLLATDNQEIVYFGDRQFSGMKQYVTLENTKNYSVHAISYTKYLDVGTLTLLTEIYNQDDQEALIPISLYVDNTFFGAKQVRIEAGSSGKVFFEDIPVNVRGLKVQLDVTDNLDIDNVAYGLVSETKIKKALLVSEGNQFLEKALRLHPNLDLVSTSSDLYSGPSYSGFDLYVFDGVLPEILPTEGALLIINPNDNERFPAIGYVKNPVLMTKSHAVTRHIEKPEFSTRIASVFDGVIDKDIIYSSEFGVSAYSTVLDKSKTVVFGFDFHETDLPLSIEFPILMINTVDYLLTNGLVEEGAMFAGDQVAITILPRAVKAYVTAPDGRKTEISIDKKDFIYSDTGLTGRYLIEEVTGDETISDAFTMNVPVNTESDESLNLESGLEKRLSSKSLELLLGLCVLALILLEWIIYSYRRKIHGNTF